MSVVLPIYSPLKMTFEKYLEWLDEDTRAEWVDGEVEIQMSPVSLPHQEVVGFLFTLLNILVQEERAGIVLEQPFVMKTTTGREPDILFVATENVKRLTNNYLNGPADLVIEVVSPESQTRDRKVKLAEYEAAGVREYWIVDPAKSEALFYQMQENGSYSQVTTEEGSIYRSRVIESLWIDINWLWQRPLPTPISVLRLWRLV